MDFKQVEERFKQLKDQYITGALSETEFKSQLEALMVQDENGNWWTIGYETELWYRHDETNWVQADPPGRQPLKSTEPATKEKISKEDVAQEKLRRETDQKVSREKTDLKPN